MKLNLTLEAYLHSDEHKKKQLLDLIEETKILRNKIVEQGKGNINPDRIGEYDDAIDEIDVLFFDGSDSEHAKSFEDNLGQIEPMNIDEYINYIEHFKEIFEVSLED